MPFTALLVVFFVIVALIHDQHLFEPVIDRVLALEGRAQAAMLYVATGALSAISDNVFVATIYITEIKAALLQGDTTREQFDVLAVAINTGTNIPSVATPNGQAAFLFLLTSLLAPLIRLGYMTMIWMALPYTVVMTAVGLHGRDLAAVTAPGRLDASLKTGRANVASFPDDPQQRDLPIVSQEKAPA